MNKKICTALLFAAATTAAMASDTCEEARKVNGVLTYVKVACQTNDRPLVCTRRYMQEGATKFEEVPCPTGGPQTVQEEEKAEVAAQKKKCGKDFGKIRVGMRLERFEECTDGLAYETDTVAKGGVVETYRSTFYYVHAKDGKIVAFTHRQN